MVVTFRFLRAADQPYKYYDFQVDHSGVTYSDQIPCDAFNARCLSVHNTAESYEVEVLNGGKGNCNQQYTIHKGTQTEQTIFTGQCISMQTTRFLITCKPKNKEDPNYKTGWIIVNFNQDNTVFDAYSGAKARFLNNGENEFLTHDRSGTQNPKVEAYCPSSGRA